MGLRKVVLLISILTLIVPSALAQTSTTSVRGTITDPKGAVIPNADVVLENPQTGFSRTAKTANDGVYQFQQIPPGTYILNVAASGFGKVQRSNVQLLVNTPATVNFELRVTSETTVEVSGEAPMINTQDASIGNAFSTQQIQNLPFEGREPVSILSLQPGVVFTGNSGSIDPDFDSRSGAVNGARSDQTNITIDGVDNNDSVKGYAFQGALRSTLDSLQEFRVTTSNANADAGRSSGAQVALVTKSGTNHFHGTAYEYHRPTFTAANDWFNKKAQIASGLPNTPPKILRNTFGGSVGGPIIKDRLFIFGAYEGNRLRESSQVTRIVPSEFLRQGIVRYIDASGNVVTLTSAQLGAMDPNCGTNGTCPLGPGANPEVMSIFQQYPLPNTDTVGDGLNYRGFTFSAPTPANLNTFITKLDFNLTSNHHLFVRGGMQDDHVTRTTDSDTETGSGGPQFPGDLARHLDVSTSKGVIAGYTGTFGSNLVNNFRWGYIRQSLVNSGLSAEHFIRFRGLDDLQGFTRATSTTVPVHNFADDVSWIRSKHTLQFGGNFRFIRDARLSTANSFFTNTTNVSWLDNAAIANTGSSLDPAAFGLPAVADSFSSSYDSPVMALIGLVSEVDAIYNRDKTAATLPEGTPIARKFQAWEAEWYGQDSWRIKPNLTLTFGLRYTLLQPPFESNGVQVAPSVSLNQFFKNRADAMVAGQTYNPLVSFDLSGQANGGKPYWDWDYKDLAPRLSFAWSPNLGGQGKTVLRGGYGLYYDHFGEGIVNTFDRQGSFGLSTIITNSAAVQGLDCGFRFTGLNTIPAPGGSFCGQTLVATPPAGSFPITPPSDLFAITWGLDDKLKTPYSHVFDISISRELPGGFVVEGAYVGRLGRRLLQEDDLAMPLNIVDPQTGVDYFTAATQFARLAEAGTPVSQVTPIPYWEHLFPNAAGPGLLSGNNAGTIPCGPGPAPANPTATQNMYDLYACFLNNETTALFVADLLCFPACATLGGVTQPNQFFDGQWSSLYSWRSVGSSSYHGAQFMVRHAMSHGLQFDFNYTLSKSIDLGSNAERINQFEGNGGLGGQIINAWALQQNRAVSDYDTRHQINSNWVYELPLGEGKRWGSHMGTAGDALLGGWLVSGLFRWSSGYPFSVNPGLGFWPTNWELTSSLVQLGALPKTGAFTDADGDPNVFANGPNAEQAFRFSHPGETGQRNILRGPGSFGVDLGLSKAWKITENQSLKFSWETFNVTNSVRFDVGTLSASKANSSSFGKFNSTLTKPRVMQFALRYSF